MRNKLLVGLLSFVMLLFVGDLSFAEAEIDFSDNGTEQVDSDLSFAASDVAEVVSVDDAVPIAVVTFSIVNDVGEFDEPILRQLKHRYDIYKAITLSNDSLLLSNYLEIRQAEAEFNLTRFSAIEATANYIYFSRPGGVDCRCSVKSNYLFV